MQNHWRLPMVAGACLTLGAQAPPDIPKLDIEKYTLANGLEVILSEDRRLPLVGVDVWYHVGPRTKRRAARASRICSST